MKNKIIYQTILILSAIAFTGIGTSAMAGWSMGYGHHGPMHHGWGHHGPGEYGGGGWGSCYMSNLSEDEFKALQKERNAFFAATADLRQEIFQKRLELRSELAKRDPDANKAAKIQEEISKLVAEFDQKRIDHIMKMRKINPNVGMGFMGGGRMGPGMIRSGCPNYPYSGHHMGSQHGYGMGPGMMMDR